MSSGPANSKAPLTLSGGLLRAGTAIVAVSVAGKLFSFGRDVICAKQFGASRSTDVYFFVFNIWVVFCVAVATSVASLAVPAITRRIADGGDEAGEGLAKGLFVQSALWFGAAAGLIWIAVPILVGWGLPALRDADRRLAENLVRVTVILLPVLIATSALGSLLRVRGRFGWAELPLAMANMGSLVGIGAGGAAAGLTALAWGTSAGAVVGAAMLIVVTGVGGYGFRAIRDSARDGLRLFGRALGLTFVGHSGGYAAGFLENLFTIRLPAGDLSILAYSRRFLLLIPQIVMPAVLTPGLPEMAHAAHSGQPTGANRVAAKLAGLLTLVLTPVLSVSVALSVPLVELLFGRGRFEPAQVQATALVASSLALIPIVSTLRNVFTNRLLASGHSLQPIIAGIAGVVAFGVTAAICWRNLGLWGVIVAQYVADMVGMAVVATSARRRFHVEVTPILGFTARVAFAGVAAGAVGWTVYRGLEPAESAIFSKGLVSVLASAALVVGAYGGFLPLAGVRWWRILREGWGVEGQTDLLGKSRAGNG